MKTRNSHDRHSAGTQGQVLRLGVADETLGHKAPEGGEEATPIARGSESARAFGGDRVVPAVDPKAQALPMALAEVIRSVASDCGAVYILSEAGDLVMEVSQGFSAEFVQRARRLRLGEGVSGQAAQLRQPLTRAGSDLPAALQLAPLPERETHGRCASAPLLLGQRVLGAVMVYRLDDAPFLKHEMDLLASGASLLALLCERAELIRSLARTNEELLAGLAQRRRAEEELEEGNWRLEEALGWLQQVQVRVIQQERLQAIGEMASGIAHDFNNSLTPILGLTDVLLTSPGALGQTHKVREYLQVVHDAAKNAREVIRRMREFYRRREDSGAFEPVDINRIVEQTILLAQPKWKDQAQATGITIEMKTDLVQVQLIDGNEGELKEMLLNLVMNSADALPQGGTISVRTRREDERVVMEVADTGVGMTEEVRRRCLEPFFTTKGVTGTGLGLAIVHGVVRRHNGTLAIESAPGKGTLVSIQLPVRSNRPTLQKPSQSSVPVKPLRLLVVDDEASVRRTLGSLLSIDGHSVTLATGARDGLAKWRSGTFDVLLVERAMQDMSGDQLAAIVKKADPKQPVIMLTGFGGMMDAAGENPPNVDRVVSKPVTHAELQQALAAVLVG